LVRALSKSDTASNLKDTPAGERAVLALTLTNLTVYSLKASALFDLLAPPLHMAGH
jgi:hypothetical protein